MDRGTVDPGMPTVTRDGVAIDYAVDGDPDGPTVLLLEGLGYGRWMWRWLAEALADGYEVLRPDNRGTGDSDVPEGPYTVPEMAADAAAVLDDRDADAVHVCGASMGGMIAQELALADDRVASLTLLCTSPGGDDAAPTPPEVQEHIFSAPEDADPRERIRYLMEPAVSDGFYEREPELVDRIVDWRLAGDATPTGREAQAAAVAAFDASDRLDAVDVPTLILHGTADRVLPAENAELLADRLPHADVELFDGGPHLFFIEERERVNDRIRTFLGEVA
ncbi:hydrolase or acyltransferase of alpha/beta superfamily protein [Halorubrum californiense DSM 19288]|uniref:Hydrolase or acyltransferase of alpha/beta superfamily protein n=2 Tax=Haloferacaceae TaxID=1644056 RepID=M0E2Z7_9EURY|nr:hydrolase or acyltransferase of alpha/beta superfamily protein [Halorubrum californiense DSM 19288]